jgi:hypothetical protein
MFEMIYPILDEITLDPIESQMKPYQDLLAKVQSENMQKLKIKVPNLALDKEKPKLSVKKKIVSAERENA